MWYIWQCGHKYTFTASPVLCSIRSCAISASSRVLCFTLSPHVRINRICSQNFRPPRVTRRGNGSFFVVILDHSEKSSHGSSSGHPVHDSAVHAPHAVIFSSGSNPIYPPNLTRRIWDFRTIWMSKLHGWCLLLDFITNHPRILTIAPGITPCAPDFIPVLIL